MMSKFVQESCVGKQDAKTSVDRKHGKSKIIL